jgi:hypothetical protein
MRGGAANILLFIARRASRLSSRKLSRSGNFKIFLFVLLDQTIPLAIDVEPRTRGLGIFLQVRLLVFH